MFRMWRAEADAGGGIESAAGARGSAWVPVNLPVFKTGVSRVNPGSGRFDSDTLPPFVSLGQRLLSISGNRTARLRIRPL